MKRSLLWSVALLVVLGVPTIASACDEICETLDGPCVYQAGITADCHSDGFSCWYSPGICFTSGSTQPELLSSKWKIASIEIERRGPVEPRAEEIRVAAKPETRDELPRMQ